MGQTRLQRELREATGRFEERWGLQLFDTVDDPVTERLLARLVLTAALEEVQFPESAEQFVACVGGMVHQHGAPGPVSVDLLRQVMDQDCDGRPHHVVGTRPAVAIDAANLARQQTWSLETFGPDESTDEILAHLRSELDEIEDAPSDVTEWVDVVIIAFDGAMRAGHTPQEVLDAVVAKQDLNRRRRWPDWRDASPGEAPHHLEDEPELAPPVIPVLVAKGMGVVRSAFDSLLPKLPSLRDRPVPNEPVSDDVDEETP